MNNLAANNPSTDNEALIKYLLRLGDDALIIGQRLIEWSSKAPSLEEDLAISNTSLDFLGRARFFYDYAAELSTGDVSEDDFAFNRDCLEFRNCLIYELPIGDFAFTYVRQFFIDAFDVLFFEIMLSSTDERLAAIAAKVVKESRYHLRHSTEWMKRLAGGTEESRRRLIAALDELTDFAGELFEVDEFLEAMIQDGSAVDVGRLKVQWQETIFSVFSQADITLPEFGEWHHQANWSE